MSDETGRDGTNNDIGGLTVTINDRSIEIAVTGGGRHVIPVGPCSLSEREFERFDPPPASCLTNAIGLVQDHLDDILMETPSVAATPSVVFTGHHAASLGRVEIGADALPDGYRALRSDIDDVFRTLVAETPLQRRSNPGLDDEHTGTVIATCCVTLAIMRRLTLSEAIIIDDHTPRLDRREAVS